MTYAHITADTIDALGTPPDLEWDGTRWWDLRDPAIRQSRGWLEVTETPRPEPVEGGVHESSVQLVDGLPVRVWTWRAWTADEISAQAEAEQQQARYVTHEAILDATAALMADAHTDGAAWVQPTGAHDAYALGITVTHGGKTWENITPANVWEPGVSGWREVVTEGYPAWVQPTGAHDAYILGAKVIHNGRLWECAQVNAGVNAYEPGVWGWTDIGAAP